jgi:acyl-CoA reductase-like NAD-dependent aldehyde dehydrogenase
VVPIWTTETLRVYLLGQMESLEARVLEQRRTSERAIDLAFEVQEKALAIGVGSQKVAVDAAFSAQKESVAAALAAADRAVQKAETSAEKRFEAVNEFRETLADQQRSLMPRAETEALMKAMDAKLEVALKSMQERTDQNAKHLATMEDRSLGTSNGWQWAVLVVGLFFSLVGVLAFVGSLFKH